MERTLLIINPVSGTTSKRGIAERIESKLSQAGFDVEVKLTTGRGDATRLASYAVDNGFHTVVAIGGDGTVNETATALCDSDVALAIIPAGSGNGLASTFPLCSCSADYGRYCRPRWWLRMNRPMQFPLYSPLRK